MVGASVGVDGDGAFVLLGAGDGAVDDISIGLFEGYKVGISVGLFVEIKGDFVGFIVGSNEGRQ